MLKATNNTLNNTFIIPKLTQNFNICFSSLFGYNTQNYLANNKTMLLAVSGFKKKHSRELGNNSN